MELHRKRQLKRTALFIILICVFTAGGFWFRAHPLFTEEGGSWKKRTGSSKRSGISDRRRAGTASCASSSCSGTSRAA